MYRPRGAGGATIGDADIDQFIPAPSQNLQMVEFPFDILAARDDQIAGNYSFDSAECPTVVAIRAGDASGLRILDRLTAAVLAICDGEDSIAEIIERFRSADEEDSSPDAIRERIEALFKVGLIDLVRRNGPNAPH